MQMIAKRIEKGMGIIKRVIGSDKQNTHFPARVRNPLLVQEQDFGEQVERRGRERRRRRYGISQQWRHPAIYGILTIPVDNVYKVNEPLLRTITHATHKILLRDESYPHGT